MSKPQIILESLLKDLDDAFKLIDKIEEGNLSINKITKEAKRLKNIFEKKYPNNLDTKE